MGKTIMVEIYSSGSEKCHQTYELINGVVSKHCDEYCVIRIHDVKIPEVAARAQSLGINKTPAVLVNGKLLKDYIGKVPPKNKIMRLVSSKQPA